MKKSILLAGFAIVTSLFLSFRDVKPSSIKGTVSPAWYAVRAWAISETDTLYSTVTNGHFEFSDAKPGTYRIIIEAKSPYRHMVKENVAVSEGAANIGELSLQKWE